MLLQKKNICKEIGAEKEVFMFLFLVGSFVTTMKSLFDSKYHHLEPI
jgi:hypothetical protein